MIRPAVYITKTLRATVPIRCVGVLMVLLAPTLHVTHIHAASIPVELRRWVLQSDECSTSSSDESNEELPYGGDMQRAVQAQDRDAIRTLMAARKSGSKEGGSKVRESASSNTSFCC